MVGRASLNLSNLLGLQVRRSTLRILCHYQQLPASVQSDDDGEGAGQEEVDILSVCLRAEEVPPELEMVRLLVHLQLQIWY